VGVTRVGRLIWGGGGVGSVSFFETPNLFFHFFLCPSNIWQKKGFDNALY